MWMDLSQRYLYKRFHQTTFGSHLHFETAKSCHLCWFYIHLKMDYYQYEWDCSALITTITTDPSFVHDIKDLHVNKWGLLSLTNLIQSVKTKQNRWVIWTLVHSALGITGAILFVICIRLKWSAVYYTRLFQGINHVNQLTPFWWICPSTNSIYLLTTVNPNINYSPTNWQLGLKPSFHLFFLGIRI